VRDQPERRLGEFLAELEWRGILHGTTPGLPARLASGRPISAYIGFDPSADSLHVGHLVPIFGLLRLQRFGGRPVALVGGGTGMIGDPSGRSAERNLLDRETLEANVVALRGQLERFLDFSPGAGAAVMVNNLDWLGGLGLIDFLRDTGKHFTIPYMLAKDSIQTRLDRGLSFTEFSYMLLQAYDFEHLHRTMGVELQMGGADQWGNITAGLELIRRLAGADEGAEPAHALACKLLLSPSGAKFGKSERGESVWLDPDRTSPYAFYQYWLNVDDRDTGTYLRWFTEFSRDEIEALEVEASARPELRSAQRALARDITMRTHGTAVTAQVEQISESVFSRTLATSSPDMIAAAVAWLPSIRVPASRFAHGMSAAQISVSSTTHSSLSAARRSISQGGFYINEERITDPDDVAAVPEPVAGKYYVLRSGKKNYRILVLYEDNEPA
jgi:tyrosyl-tRNA synthetase